MRTRAWAILAIGTLIAAGAAVGPAAADNTTVDCLQDEHRRPRIGDGPWVGDAPDDASTLLTPGCWNGRTHGPDDVDSYHIPGRQMTLHVTEGCVGVGASGPEAIYDPLDPGTSGFGVKCAPHEQDLFFWGAQREFAFYGLDNGTGVYEVEL